MWTNRYEDLLLEWADLRNRASSLPLEDALHLVQNWWNTAPITNPYLHIADCDEWPLPWDLLAQNGFCDLAKCIGICYTLILAELPQIKSLHIVQTDNYYTIVHVNDGQYVLNDCIGEIIPSDTDYRIRHSVDCQCLANKLK